MFTAQSRKQCGTLLAPGLSHALNLLKDLPYAYACCMLGSTTIKVVSRPTAATIAMMASVVLLFILFGTRDR